MNQKGFSLIELLVVVSFIAILGAMAQTQYAYYKRESYNSVTNADMRNSMTGLEVYQQDNSGNYPTCDASTCEGTLPGFKQSPGVQLAYTGVDDTSVTAIACHDHGDMRYIFTGIPGLIIGLRTGPCGA